MLGAKIEWVKTTPGFSSKSGIIATPASGISSLEDRKGARVAVNPAGLAPIWAWPSWRRRRKCGRSSIRIVANLREAARFFVEDAERGGGADDLEHWGGALRGRPFGIGAVTEKFLGEVVEASRRAAV